MGYSPWGHKESDTTEATAHTYLEHFPGGSVVKNPPAKQETLVQSLAQGDSLEEEMAKPLQYSCLGNPTDREAWRDPSSITIRI